jgi:putative transposase
MKLHTYLFESLDDMRAVTDEWIGRYNERRPHDALGSLPPARYRERLLAIADSTFKLST